LIDLGCYFSLDNVFLSYISVEWDNESILIMAICRLTAVSGLILQYYDFKTINDFYQNSNTKKYPIFLFIGKLTVAGGAISFGRSYAPFVVALISLFASWGVGKWFLGLTDGFEKTTLLATFEECLKYMIYIGTSNGGMD
jgi:hypothetical protein